MTKTKILIDCDPGHDDAVALLVAAQHLDLVGVTTVHGNASLADTTRNALAILELAGIDVPLARGCAEPLFGKPVHAAAIHGKSGLDGADLPAPTRTVVDIDAIDFIIETARHHQGELVVAVIGPQTNLAMALKREPRLAGWLREISIMGGSTATGNITPAAEFNIFCDPEAASVVFACGAPIRMVGLNITRQTGFDSSDIERLRTSGRRVAKLIGDLMAFYLGRQSQTFGLGLAPMHDVCAIIPYVAPGLIDYVETSVAVEVTGRHTRGMTVCDMRNVRPNALESIPPVSAPNARVAVRAQSRPLIDLVMDAILQFH